MASRGSFSTLLVTGTARLREAARPDSRGSDGTTKPRTTATATAATPPANAGRQMDGRPSASTLLPTRASGTAAVIRTRPSTATPARVTSSRGAAVRLGLGLDALTA